MTNTNRRFLLAKRPVGAVRRDDFSFETVPAEQPGEGQVLVRNLYLSLDPAMRGWMNEGKSYIPPVALGQVMRALGVDSSWSPDGRYIAFQCDSQEQDLTAFPPPGPRICLASVDGSEVHELTAPDVGSSDSMPAWSPDSSTVIFRRILSGVAIITQIQRSGSRTYVIP